MRSRLRDKLAEVFEPYQSGVPPTPLSLGVDIFILLCILCSCALVVLEHLVPNWEPLWWALEVGFVSIFIGEYVLRWYAAPRRLTYPFGVYALIDLVAILPTILVLAPDALMLRLVRGVRLLRILRLLRLVRLLRLLRFGHLIRDLLLRARIALSAAVYQYRLGQVGRLFLWVLVAWVIGANALHITEVALAGKESKYYGYWQSYWNIMIVLTSGIEDKEPLSLLGRVEVTVMVLAGVCVVALFTGQIVSVVVRRSQGSGRVAMMPPGATFANHILILGKNLHLDAILRQLHAALNSRYHILVLCPEADQLVASDARIYRHVYALAGDPREARFLAQAGAERAARLIVLSAAGEPDADPQIRDSRTLMVTLAALNANRDAPVVVELESPETLHQAAILRRVEFVVSKRDSARLIKNAVLSPGTLEVIDHLMTFGDETCEFYEIAVPPELVGGTFLAAQLHFLDQDNEAVVLLGLASKGSGKDREVVLAPRAGQNTGEIVLRAQDRLVVSAYSAPRYARAQAEDLWTGKILLRR